MVDFKMSNITEKECKEKRHNREYNYRGNIFCLECVTKNFHNDLDFVRKKKEIYIKKFQKHKIYK